MTAPRRWAILAILALLALPLLLHAAPLTPAPQEPASDSDINQNQRHIDALQKEQAQLLAQVHAQLAALPQLTAAQLASDPAARAQEQRRQQLAQMLATIERRIQEQNARPRKRFFTPATMAATYPQYFDALCRQIETRGAEKFPQADGRKLYGRLLMALLINFDGRLLDARVVTSSGNPTLDRLTQDIARSAAPFGPFTPAMRQDADQIDISMGLNFTHNGTSQPGSDCSSSSHKL